MHVRAPLSTYVHFHLSLESDALGLVRDYDVVYIIMVLFSIPMFSKSRHKGRE